MNRHKVSSGQVLAGEVNDEAKQSLLHLALLLLLRNISQTKRGEQDGYLGGDWKVEQVAWAISLCVWLVKRARSPPVDEKLERMRG